MQKNAFRDICSPQSMIFNCDKSSTDRTSIAAIQYCLLHTYYREKNLTFDVLESKTNFPQLFDPLSRPTHGQK